MFHLIKKINRAMLLFVLLAGATTAHAQLTVSASPVTICSGSSAVLNLSVSGGLPPYTYNWGPSTGLSATNVANPIASPATSTNYNVIVTDANSSSNSTTVMVTVLATPVADAGPDQTGCDGTGYTFSAAPVSGGTYNWDFGDGFTDSGQSLLHYYEFAGTYTATLTVISSSGCSATDQLTVTQHDNPETLLNSHRSCASICNGAISSEITMGNIPPLTYSWDNGATTDSIFGLCTGFYTLTVTNSAGCAYTVTAAVDQAYIYVNASPFQTICAGDSAHITASVNSFNPVASYTWDNGSAPFTTTDSTVTVSPVTGTSYTITVTDSEGCTSNGSTGVSVNPGTDIYGNVTYSSGALNTGTNTAVLFRYEPSYMSFDSIQVSSIDASGYYHFTTVNNGDYLIEAFPDLSVHPTLVRTYYGSAFLWDSAMVLHHDCGATDTADIVMVETPATTGPGLISGHVYEGDGFIRAPGEPIPGIDIKLGRNPGGQLVTSGTTGPDGSYSFANIPLNNPGDHYTVYADIPGLERISTYDVTLDATHVSYDSLDYIADSNSVYIDPLVSTGIAVNKAQSNSLSIYPNPSNGNTTVEYTLAAEAKVSLAVYNVLGVKVAELANTAQSAGSYTCHFNSKNYNLNPGVYFINLVTDGKQSVLRLVIAE